MTPAAMWAQAAGEVAWVLVVAVVIASIVAPVVVDRK